MSLDFPHQPSGNPPEGPGAHGQGTVFHCRHQTPGAVGKSGSERSAVGSQPGPEMKVMCWCQAHLKALQSAGGGEDKPDAGHSSGQKWVELNYKPKVLEH